MKKELKIYRCAHCGTIVELIDGHVTPSCCGQPMDLLKPNTVDAAQEKHVPVVRREGDKLIVEVGSVHHPMTQEHYIPYIWVVFDNKVGRAHLTPDDEPVAEFFPGEGPLKVYGYCNLHGLWETDID